MRLGVLGGAGAMGRVTVADAAQSDGIEAVAILDRDASAATELKQQLSGARAEVRVQEADGRDLARLFTDLDVVVNAASHRLNVEAMEACLEVGAHYADLGGLFHYALEQFALDERFRSAGLSAAISTGTAPGITNMLAAACCEQLASVETIELVDALVEEDDLASEAGFVAAYAADTLISEFTDPAAILVEGEFRFVPAGSGAKVYRLPEGDVECVYTIHSEPATLRMAYAEKGLRNVEWRLGLPARDAQVLRALVAAGLASTDAIRVGDAHVRPRDVLVRTLDRQRLSASQGSSSPAVSERLRACATGRTPDGQAAQLMAEIGIVGQPSWPADAATYATGVAPSIAAQLLGSGAARRCGVGGPEETLPVEPFFTELAKRGIGPPLLTTQTLLQTTADLSAADSDASDLATRH